MQRLKYWLVTFVGFYSVIVGSTLLKIDVKKRTLKKTTLWLKIYVIIGNIGFLSWLPHAVGVNMSHVQLFVANPIAAYANWVTLTSRLMVMLGAVLTRPKRDADLSKWLETMLQIQTAYFDRFKDIPKDIAHRKWLYLNSAIAYLHTLGTVAGMYQDLFKGHIITFMDIFPLYGMISFQHIYMLHHAALLCYVRESFSILNHQLTLNRLDPKLSLIYSQLRFMMQRLNSIYSPMILCIQLGQIISNSMVGYICILMLLHPQSNFTSYSYLFGSSLYVCLLVHMYSYFMLCDWVAATAKETDIILFEYSTGGSAMEEIEKIALSCSLQKASIRISGMFDVNLNTLFSIIAQTLLYTIILVQVYFDNRLHQ